MKEITRIHIAKVSYEIELEAKKELEAYLRTLESYSKDTEIIDDVEIRITEILADRGVQKSGVISGSDVEALKSQLGDPSEFADEEDKEAANAPSGDVTRKLYRDTDHAVLGGVLSGVAAFFKINPLWVRLIFIILALASFGTALLVYIVLWAAVPPARTATDKLQMTGRPVTVESIRELNENEVSKPESSSKRKRIWLTILGIHTLLAALCSAAVVVGISIFGFTGEFQTQVADVPGSEFFITAFVLALISGVLFTALMMLATYAAFAAKATKRVIISGVVIIVLGLTAFGAAAATAQYGAYTRNQQIEQNTRETNIVLPETAKDSTALLLDASDMEVEYIVTTDEPKATLRTVSPRANASVDTKVTQDKKTLRVTAKASKDEACNDHWCWWSIQTKLTIYGPALTEITAAEKSHLTYTASRQDKLEVVADKNAVVQLSGTIDTLSATVRNEASVIATDAGIERVDTTLAVSAELSLATIQSLVVTGENVCPSGVREARVGVEQLLDTSLTLNGTRTPAKSMDSGCLEIDIDEKGMRR